MNLPEITTIGLIGEGSWATAIIKLLQNQPGELQWYIRTEEIREGINKNGRNPLYLSDVHVNQTGLTVSGDIRSVVSASDIIVVVLPAAFIESTFSDLSSDSFEGKFLVSAVKGMIPDLEQTPCEFFHKRFGIPSERLAFITGPSHAEEVALERLTFLTVHGENASLTKRMASLLACQYIRTKTGNDLSGAEYATAMKNIMSIGAGLIHSLGYGDNLLAVMFQKRLKKYSIL
jgi:glycerol-3-phosphate dehydrogenase (NAD(P)+)